MSKNVITCDFFGEGPGHVATEHVAHAPVPRLDEYYEVDHGACIREEHLAAQASGQDCVPRAYMGPEGLDE